MYDLWFNGERLLAAMRFVEASEAEQSAFESWLSREYGAADLEALRQGVAEVRRARMTP